MNAQPPTYDTSVTLDWLAAQQRRVTGILAGLDEQALRRPVLPSGWSCAGMVQHLTATTRFWLVEVMTGHLGGPPLDDEFQVPDNRSAAAVLQAYQDEAEAAVKLVRELPPDTPPAWWPEGQFGDWRLDDLREVLLHLLVETSCHAGHLDAARELLDGCTWDYEHGRVSSPNFTVPEATSAQGNGTIDAAGNDR